MNKTNCCSSSYTHPRCEFKLCSWRGVLDTTLFDKVCQSLATGLWFSPGTPVSSTNKTEHHDITEILLKVALNTITLSSEPPCLFYGNIYIYYFDARHIVQREHPSINNRN